MFQRRIWIDWGMESGWVSWSRLLVLGEMIESDSYGNGEVEGVNLGSLGDG